MFQVAFSVNAGWVMPSMLPRKLGTDSRRNLLYRSFRELGRVERTLLLLRFVSSAETVQNVEGLRSAWSGSQHEAAGRLAISGSPGNGIASGLKLL
jgi:hypothetical protein